MLWYRKQGRRLWSSIINQKKLHQTVWPMNMQKQLKTFSLYISCVWELIQLGHTFSEVVGILEYFTYIMRHLGDEIQSLVWHSFMFDRHLTNSACRWFSPVFVVKWCFHCHTSLRLKVRVEFFLLCYNSTYKVAAVRAFRLWMSNLYRKWKPYAESWMSYQ